MIRVLGVLAAGLVASNLAGAGELLNGDFSAEAGEWFDGNGPPGWELSLGDEDQFGIVESADFSEAGGRVFRFSRLQTGYGGSRMDQCVALDGSADLQMTASVRVDDPHADMRARLRLDFYSDSECDSDSAGADTVQVETDIPLDAERAPEQTLVALESEPRWASELGDDVGSVRVSFRLRDRSDDGQPVDPPRRVYVDEVRLDEPDAGMPAEQRQALRDLYQAAGGEHWRRSDGWMAAEGTECQWFGVTCAPDGSGLMRLDLAANRLSGELPGSLEDLDTLDPGGLDLCWNDLEPAQGSLADFVQENQLGGAEAECDGTALNSFDATDSGVLRDPGRSGEGFALHMQGPGSAILYWATYDHQGDPLWLEGSGRQVNRVLRFDTLYRTRRVDGQVQREPVGRASLALAECGQARFHFDLFGPDSGARAVRELDYLDGRDECGQPTPGVDSPDIQALGGVWYDPAHSGEGWSLSPLPGNRVHLMHFHYDPEGHPRWSTAVAHPDSGGFQSEPLLAPRGGHLVEAFDYHDLEFGPDGHTRLETGPVMMHTDSDGADSVLHLVGLLGGPALRASSGNRLDLTMSSENAELLYDRDPYSDERLPGEAQFAGSGTVLPLHGLRFRGRSSRLLPKKSFNVRFETPQPLLFDSPRMNLNADYTDPALMREELAFGMFAELDRPAPRTAFFDLWLNDIYEGLYVHVQRVDETLLEQSGLNPDGTLVRDRFRLSDDPLIDRDSAFGFDLSVVPEDEREDLLEDNFNDRGDPRWDQVRDLVEWVHDTPAGDVFLEGFQQRFQVDNFVDWVALHWLIGDIDSWGDDYWLYLDHEDPDARWHVIPWDKDLSFGSHYRDGWFTDNDFFAYEYSLDGGGENELVRRFLQTPELRQMLEARVAELMATFTPQWFAQRVEDLADRLAGSLSITPGAAAFRRHPGNHHGQPGRLEDHAEALTEFVHLRYRYILRQLDPVPGQPYQAGSVLEQGSDQRTFLTDAEGFSLVSLAPAQAWPMEVSVSAAVEAGDRTGIDRTWIVEVEADAGNAELVLFYRNDVAPWLGDNWWTEGDEPVGCQDHLVIHRLESDGSVPLETRVNPFANRAAATVDLAPGTHRFALVLDEQTAGTADCM